MLETNERLEEISLTTNKISNPGAVSIANGLKENVTVQLVFLQNNNISDDSCINLKWLIYYFK